ncbi:MAG: hypothetical protein II630_04835 [Bacteroidales bacterium]|nr:hypothetical protein [Bacteroidales bacterium]
MKNNSLAGVLAKLAIFGVGLFAVHFPLARAFPVCAAEGIYEAHLFLFVLTVAVVLVLKFIFRKMTQKQGLFGYVFMASSLVKMALCVVFLIPIIRGDADYRIAYVVQFFILYFAYLVMEVVLVAKLLKSAQEKQDSSDVKQE